MASHAVTRALSARSAGVSTHFRVVPYRTLVGVHAVSASHRRLAANNVRHGKCVQRRRRGALSAGRPSERSAHCLTRAASSATSPGSSASTSSGDVALTVDMLSKTHDGTRQLFSELSFSVASGDRMVVIGPNGCGKSSLLNIIAGKDEPTSGNVTRRRGQVVAMLEQNPRLPEDLGALDAVLSMDNPKSQAVRDYEAAVTAVELGVQGSDAMLSRCTARMDTIGAWELGSKAKAILETLGIPDVKLKVADMSGGQRRRVALASAILSEPDFILLDEPTNHMDVGVIAWMAEWLNQSKMAVMFVTHDRNFMEAVGTRVLELDADGSSHVHKFGGEGSYDRFLQTRSERRAAQAAVAANAKTLLRTETEWMRRQPKARSTKSRARVDAFYELSETARSGPKDDQVSSFQQGSSMQRQGKRVMELQNASYCWGDKPIFQSMTYEFQPGEKIGIVGPNGCGKSTFLDALAGRVELTGGERSVGERTAFGYFNQHPPSVRHDMRVADYLREVADLSSSGSHRDETFGRGLSPTTVLDQVCFPRERHFELVGKLSGGERRRLHLAATLMSGPNFLLLDEPTNDLDLQTIEMLEFMLQDYTGVLVTVSHDYQFMDNNADRLFVFEGDGVVRLFDGTYSEYMALAAEASDQAAKKKLPAKEAPVQSPKHDTTNQSDAKPNKLLKLGYRERQEYEGLEEIIDDLSAKQDELELQISDANAAGDYSTLGSLTEALAKVQEQLEKKTDRWLELAERADI